jgi:hypothetical protein
LPRKLTSVHFRTALDLSFDDKIACTTNLQSSAQVHLQNPAQPHAVPRTCEASLAPGGGGLPSAPQVGRVSAQPIALRMPTKPTSALLNSTSPQPPPHCSWSKRSKPHLLNDYAPVYLADALALILLPIGRVSLPARPELPVHRRRAALRSGLSEEERTGSGRVSQGRAMQIPPASRPNIHPLACIV